MPKEEGVIDYIPEGYITFAAMREELNLTDPGLNYRIAEIGLEIFGDILRYKAKGKPGLAMRLISRSQQDLLRDRYSTVIDHIPEGYVRVAEFGLTPQTLKNKIERIGYDIFGKILRYREPGSAGGGPYILSPYQQELLSSPAAKEYDLAVDELLDVIPDGYKTWAQVGEKLHLSIQGIESRTKKIGHEKFGKITRYRKPGTSGAATRLLSPDQQELLDQYGSAKGEINYIPEGYKTIQEIKVELGYNSIQAMDKAISYLQKNTDFGEMLRYRDPGKRGQGVRILSPYQQDLLRQHIIGKTRAMGSAAHAAAAVHQD